MSLMTDERGSDPRWHGRPVTVRDLDRMPDDGNRYELIDGEIFVTPAPAYRHQKIALRLYARLDAACPPHLDVLAAPFAVRLNSENEMQPDVLVAPAEAFTEKDLPVAPSLAVEVLSPSTALRDLNNKKDKYERIGVRSYWVIDPVEPNLIAFELDWHGKYRTVAKVAGDEPFEATEPFPVRVVLTELLGRGAT